MSAITDVWIEGNMRIRIECTSVQPQASSIRSAILFNLTLTPTNPTERPVPINQSTMSVINFFCELRQKTINATEVFAGQLKIKSLLTSLLINRVSGTTLIFELVQNDLKALEKLRETQDLQLTISGTVVFSYQSQMHKISEENFTLCVRVPKSDWVEKFLPALGFKTVSLIEIPQLFDDEFSEIIVHVDDAWKQYSMGEYHRVLTDCRKAKEGLSEKIKSKGFKKEETTRENKKIVVPNWEAFFGNDELGDAIAEISKKLSRITSVGAHTGRNICREEADFTLMTTHALINLVVRKCEQLQT
jgi:hypothetical protein